MTLGRFSMGKFMKGAKISQVHGEMRKVGDRYVIAMFHPAAALHQAALKPAILADFAKLPDLLKDSACCAGKVRTAGKEGRTERRRPEAVKSVLDYQTLKVS